MRIVHHYNRIKFEYESAIFSLYLLKYIIYDILSTIPETIALLILHRKPLSTHSTGFHKEKHYEIQNSISIRLNSFEKLQNS